MPRLWNYASACKNCCSASGWQPAGEMQFRRYTAALGGASCRSRSSAQPDITEVKSPGRQSVSRSKMASRLRRRTPLPEKPGVDVRKLRKSFDSQGRIFPRGEVTKRRSSASALLAEQLPQRNRLDLLAEKYVLAQTQREICASGALAGRHAGRRNDSAGVRRRERGKPIARPPLARRSCRSISRARARTTLRHWSRPKSSAAKGARRKSARTWMPLPVRFLARDGGKINRCSIRSSILPSGRP